MTQNQNKKTTDTNNGGFQPFDSHPPFKQALEMLPVNPGDAILRYAAEKPGVISLVQGQSDNVTPDFIMNAAIKSMQSGQTFYGQTSGQPVLLEALSNYYRNIFGVNAGPERFFVTPSGTAAMHIALTMLLEPGDDIVAITPIWKNLISAVELTGATSTNVSLTLDKNGKWKLDLDKLFDSVTPRTRAILVVTPSNPTGWCASETEIRAILNFARANGLWVIADEVYGRMTYDRPRAPSFHDIADDDDNLLLINSFSKNWSMTGWRLGWLAGPKRMAEKIRSAALYNHLCAPTFLQYGAAAALNDGEEFLAQHLSLWRSNREMVKERFKDHPRIRLLEPDATYYALFSVEGENDCLKLARRVIDEAGVALAPGGAFGQASKGMLRLCFAGGEEKISGVLDRLGSAL